MKILCGWCGKFLGGDKNATEVSHGICKDCLKVQLAEVEKIKEQK